LLEASLLLNNKLNLYELFSLHASARGEKTEHKIEADTVFSLDDGTTPFQVTKILSEYL